MPELDFLSVVFIGFGLSADCFAVALSGAIYMKSFSWTQALRTALTFGLFQTIMPVLGWLGGRTIVEVIETYDHWVAFGLLVLIGGRMIWEAFRKRKEERHADITKGLLLIVLAVATSIDALAVGLTFAFLRVDIVLASAVIGVIAFLVTILSFLIGRKAGSILGRRAEVIGGVILIIIGLRVLLGHLL